MSVVTAQNNGKRGLADDVKALDIASALERMKTQTVDSRIQGSVRVFGCHGVGAVTTDEACVRIDGNKVEVFLPEKVYDSLLKKALSKEPEALNKGNLKEVMKKLLLEPDELATIDGFANYLPLFNAISSCSLAVADVTYESPKVIRDVGRVLENEYRVILERESSGFTGRSIREFGLEFVIGALERYLANKFEPAPGEKPAEKAQETAQKEKPCTFSNQEKFYAEAAMLPADEKEAFFEMGKFIEQKGGITKQEGLKIFSSHYKKQPERVFGRRFSNFIFNGCLRVVGEDESAEELVAKIHEAKERVSIQKSQEPAKTADVIEEAAKETAAQGYALSIKSHFKIYIKNTSEMKPEEGKALEEIREIIEEGPIRRSEVERIYQAHGARGFEGALEYLVRYGIFTKVEISETSEVRAPSGMSEQPPKETPVVSKARTIQNEAATQQEVAKEESYTFRSRDGFYRYISTYSSLRRGAIEAVGKVIERKGAITKSEFKEIFNSHGIGFWAENGLGILLRSHDLIKIEGSPAKETQEAKIPEATELPPKEVSQSLASKELSEKLSDFFKRMDENVMDEGFWAENNAWIRVWGFRGRRGIIITNEACMDIALDMESRGGKAWVHLNRRFANSLLKTGALPASEEVKTGPGLQAVRKGSGPKPSGVSYSDVLRQDVQEKLKKYPEFTNFLSVLDFLNSRKITADVFILTHEEEKFFRLVKERYKTAAQIKDFEGLGYKCQEAVGKVFHLADFNGIRQELIEHGMRRELESLYKILEKTSEKANLSGLVDLWSRQAPENEQRLALIMGGNDPKEVKKLLEDAIMSSEETVRKAQKNLDWYTKTRSSVDAGMMQSFDVDSRSAEASLRNRTSELNNLKKTLEMLGKCGEAIRELHEKTVKEEKQPVVLTPAVDITKLQT